MVRVLLQCDDAYFVRAFGNYASSYCQTMEFVCFTTASKALDYLASAALRFDALLATKEVLEGAGQPQAVRLLVSEQTAFSDPEAMQINIYQSGPAIISDIRSALSLTGSHMFQSGDRQVRVVASYSVQGGGGKTVLSYALAAAAARSGRQALYVNLEPFPAYGQLYDHTFTHPIDDLLFALKGRRDPAAVVLDTMERNADNVMVLPPFNFAGDLLSLSQENLKTLIETLVERTSLEYIFIDLPTGFQQMNLWMLELCTSVLLVYSDDLIGREHMRRAQGDVYFQNLPIQGALLTVLNKCRQKVPEDGVTGKIPHSDSMQQGRRVAEVLERNPSFYKSCAELLDKIH